MIKIISMIWLVIFVDILLLTLPCNRKEIKAQSNGIRQLSICKNENIFKKVENELGKIFFTFIIAIALFCILISIPDGWWNFLLEWCKGTFFVSFLQLIIGRLKEQRQGNGWDRILLLFGVLTSIISCMEKRIPDDIMYKIVFSICLSLFVSILFCILMQLPIEEKQGHVKRSKVNLYHDLFARTPNIEIEKESSFELVRSCERLYYDFCVSIQKVKTIKQIQFINIFGTNKEYWYGRVAEKIKYFTVGSAAIVCYCFVDNHDFFALIGFASISACCGCVCWLKKHDKKYLIRLALRFFYDEWGYCILYTDKKDEEKCKVVGHVQLIEISKYHRFIHDLLNIAAFGRAIAYNDKLNSTCRIRCFTKNIYELSKNYNSYNENAYLQLLPLWITLLFEYYVCNGIQDISIKKYLREINIHEKSEEDIKNFLYGFWVDITRKNPCRENDKFISDFMMEVLYS